MLYNVGWFVVYSYTPFDNWLVELLIFVVNGFISYGQFQSIFRFYFREVCVCAVVVVVVVEIKLHVQPFNGALCSDYRPCSAIFSP